MTRDPVPGDESGPDGEQSGSAGQPEQQGRLRTTDPRVLLGCLLAGLVVGWALRPIAVGLDATAPRVTALQASVLYFVAAFLAIVARGTRRSVRAPSPALRPREAVNRLVLAKSCALTAALATGGYLGYALSWTGLEAKLSSARIVLSLVAAAGAALAVGASLLLERACRVRGGDGES